MKITIAIIVTIILAIYSVHAPDGNTQIGKVIDKIVQYLGIIAIPLVLLYFQQKVVTDQKDLEEQKQKIASLNNIMQQLEKEKKDSEHAQKLIVSIQNSFTKIYNDLLSDVTLLVNHHTIYSGFGQRFDRYYAEQFQIYISKIFAEKEQRILVNRILTKMSIFSEYQHEDDIKHSFFIDSLMENYKIEWGDEPSNNVRSFCNVLEKLAEEFSDDTHLETVINILKDIGE